MRDGVYTETKRQISRKKYKLVNILAEKFFEPKFIYKILFIC